MRKIHSEKVKVKAEYAMKATKRDQAGLRVERQVLSAQNQMATVRSRIERERTPLRHHLLSVHAFQSQKEQKEVTETENQKDRIKKERTLLHQSVHAFQSHPDLPE